MGSVLFAAVSIGGATVLGALLGLRLNRLPSCLDGVISGGAAGMMLCASVCGLIMPGLEEGGAVAVCVGLALGSVFLGRMNVLVPQYLERRAMTVGGEEVKGLLFVLAMAIHHLPEGLAAGVSFGADSAVETVAVCSGIAVQNIPEAMMIMPAMLHGSQSRGRAWQAAAFSGGVEILGLFLGYAAVRITTAALPVLMGFAAGAMLYIVLDTMIPDGHARQQAYESTYSVLLGFSLMLLLMELLTYII